MILEHLRIYGWEEHNDNLIIASLSGQRGK
jgi:hypothetical protein